MVLEDRDIKRNTKKIPRKMHIPIRIQTNAINKDDIAINGAYISLEDLTSTTPNQTSKKGTDVEIRYLESLKRIREKFKSSYICNQRHCPVIKDRLDLHHIEYHTDSPISQRCNFSQHVQTISLSPKPSILKRTMNPKYTQTHPMQTLPRHSDFSHAVQDNMNGSSKFDDRINYKNSSSQCDDNHNRSENNICFTTANGALKDDLQEVAMIWFQDIPMYPNLATPSKSSIKNIINEFLDKVFNLTNKEDNQNDYKIEIKMEIENFLSKLPIWYPVTKRDQDLLKEGLKESFLMKIENFRNKVLYDKRASKHIDGSVNTGAPMYPPAIDEDKVHKAIESEVFGWLMQIKFKESEDIGRTINLIDTTDNFTRHLLPILTKPATTTNFGLVLKAVIIDAINDMPEGLFSPKNKMDYLNYIAEELTNRLLYIHFMCHEMYSGSQMPRYRNMYQMAIGSNSGLRQSMLDDLICFGNLNSQSDVKADVRDISIDCMESICLQNAIKTSISSERLVNATKILDEHESVIAIKNVKDILTEDIMKQASYLNTIAVYNSEHDMYGYLNNPTTSTPKQIKNKKSTMKQNPEEVDYMYNISRLIRSWMDTLPKNFDDDKKFQDTVIMDLAGDIVDQMKLEQLIPTSVTDKNKILSYTIIRWLYRFNIFENITDDSPQIRDLIKHLNNISIPNLTQPQHGNRQAMAKVKINESQRDFYIPKGTDLLEDEISIWLNEQSTDIYSQNEENYRLKYVHELAEEVHYLLKSNKSAVELSNAITEWLKKIIKSSDKINIDKLTEDLRNRIVKVPQDSTLKENLHEKIRGKLEDRVATAKSNKKSIVNDIPLLSTKDDQDETLKGFIHKFMEYNYEVEDSMARCAFGELLNIEFRKLSPSTRKEVYDNYNKLKKQEGFSKERFEMELEYIKIISDWLKNITIQPAFNRPHNPERTEFINNLAKNIYDVEQERRNSPTAMDYNLYLASIINQFTKLLPILPEHNDNVIYMIDELMGKIIANRTVMPCCKKNATVSNCSLTKTDIIKTQNISQFIDKYIHLNANDFTNDPMKMDAWSTRVLREVKQIVQETADPSTLCKTQVYDKIMNVAIPTEESVRMFGLELNYAKEISDWMNNLPLLHNPQANEIRLKLITELAEKLSDRDRNQIVNNCVSDTETVETEMIDYITQWIRGIPLDSNKDIVIPIAVEQLQKRIKRVNKGTSEPVITEEILKNQSVASKKSKNNSKKCSSKRSKCNSNCTFRKPGQYGQNAIDAIEKWSQSLPIPREKNDNVLKDEIARKLYQKIGDLCVDPQTMYNDTLFEELLSDEIMDQLNNLCPNPNIEKKTDSLKNDLIKKIMEAKNNAQENSAGDIYKQQLVNTIEASIPNPISNNQSYDPGFEIYKKGLADIFILENVDHSNDTVKTKFVRTIRNKIDRYFDNAQRRNAIPMNKNEMFNELYSALFKVPIPNTFSMKEGVEEVKTRCVTDTWFETLPIREAFNLTEILEWDQMLTVLTKQIHELEKTEKNSGDKIRDAIAKWIVRFPLLLQEQQNNVEKYVDDLLNKLKSSKEDRKCITTNSKGKVQKKGKCQTRSTLVSTRQLPGQNNEENKSVTLPYSSKTCCQIPQESRKKPTELIIEIVENWCTQMPFPVITAQDENNNKMLRDNLLTKIIMKICELNSNPKTFNDLILYEYYLDIELENLLTNLPVCCNIEKIKGIKKNQLKESIMSMIPLMKEEKAGHEYKQELQTTIKQLLPEPLNSTSEKLAMFNKLKADIFDNFIQYNYFQDDDAQGNEIYKNNLHEIVMQYYQDVKDNLDELPVDPLIRHNQLLSALLKVPVPSNRMLQDEVEEIRMKNEVRLFFDKLAFPVEGDKDEMVFRNDVQLSLAKLLVEIEKLGHNCHSESKMKKVIQIHLNKLKLDFDSNAVDDFVSRLKTNEASRKALPTRSVSYTAVNLNPKLHSVDNHNNFRKGVSSITSPDSQNRMQNISPIEESNDQNSNPKIRAHLLKPYAGTSYPQQLSTIFKSQETEGNSNSVEPLGPSASARSGKPEPPTSEIMEVKCKCGRLIRKLKRRPPCNLRARNYCEDCGQFGPIHACIPYARPPGCFYY